MIEVPAATPVSVPALSAMVATAALLVPQVPPADASDKPITWPVQTSAGPEIGAGNGFTVTVAVRRQPVGNTYVTTAGPALMPVT